MTAPLVSVVMPAFNSARHVRSAIASVLGQTFPDWELLVIDGGSRDDTRDQVRQSAAEDPRIRLLDNRDDQGPAHARCTGIQTARGRYVAFLDADDLWLPEKLELQLDFMRSRQVRFSYARYRRMADDGSRVGCMVPMRGSFRYGQALRGRGIGTLTVVVERDLLTPDIIQVWRRAGGEEYLWWLMILRKGVTAHLLDHDLGRYRDTSGSLSKNFTYTLRSVWRMYRNDLAIPLLLAVASYGAYVVSAGWRKSRVGVCEMWRSDT
jgi:teichuronic acid biosynthesis glycosyltransferase TuaG